MIRFFRSLRQRLLRQDKFGRYLIYAIGEILLVVFGILIALNVNNWNQKRQNRQVEREILSDIRESLQKDLELTIIPNAQGFANKISLAKVLLNASETGQSLPDSLTKEYVYLARWITFKPIKTPYRMLESEGLKIISNKMLRSAIVNLYDNSYDYIGEMIVNETVNIREFYRPLIRKHFDFYPRTTDTPTGYNPYVPVDERAMFNDRDFMNMITITHNNSGRMRWLIENELRPEIESVIAAINKELDSF